MRTQALDEGLLECNTDCYTNIDYTNIDYTMYY